MPSERPPTISPQAAARWQHLPLAASPWLHEEVARRMEERLGWITRHPQTWVHWEPLRGGLQAHELLMRRYPGSECFMVLSPGVQAQSAIKKIAKPWWHPIRWRDRLRLGAVPPAGKAELLWANMALHMAADPQALLARWGDALAVDGFLMFSCLGPDTLRELRALYAVLGWPAPAHEFTDMHDWGDMLLQAGFAEPVMDMERIELTFETPQRLLQELRELGRNLHPQRFAGLRGRGWRRQLEQALLQLADPAQGGRLKLTFEIIYGHAFKPQPRKAGGSGATFSVDEMRDSLRNRKSQGPAV